MESGHEETSSNSVTPKIKKGFLRHLIETPEDPRKRTQATANSIVNLLIKEKRFMTMVEISVEADISITDVFTTIPIMYANKYLLKKFSKGSNTLITAVDEVKSAELGLFNHSPQLDKMLIEAGIDISRDLDGDSELEISYGIPFDEGENELQIITIKPLLGNPILANS